MEKITGDRHLGWLLNRREALALIKAAGATMFFIWIPRKIGSIQANFSKSIQALSTANSAALPTCVVKPEQSEGPYFVEEQLDRSDIRSDPSNGLVKEGVPLQLTLRVSQVSGTSCVPLAGARVDIWQCDASGVYSDVDEPNFNTVGQKFLRGYQVTDANGTVRFATIYPGWYPTRTVHIHVKIRTNPISKPTYEFTSQLYFDDSLTDRVHARPPYASKGQRKVKNLEDRSFRSGGNQLLLAPTKTSFGYAATFDIGLQTEDI